MSQADAFMLRKRPFTEAETADISHNWTQATPVICQENCSAVDCDVLSEGDLANMNGVAAFCHPVWTTALLFAIERPSHAAAIAEPLLSGCSPLHRYARLLPFLQTAANEHRALCRICGLLRSPGLASSRGVSALAN